MPIRRKRPPKGQRIATSDIKGVSASTRRLLTHEEGLDADFKRDPDGVKPDDFVALSNAAGGTLLIGVEEKIGLRGLQTGKIVGCNVSEKTKRNLINSAASCKPPIHIQVRRENTATRTPIIRIDVPAGTMKPYCTGGGTYKIRADGQNLAIDPQLLRAKILQAEADEFVAHFRAAADALISELQKVHADLTEQIEHVEAAASEAVEAARDAEQAAQEAALWTQA